MLDIKSVHNRPCVTYPRIVVASFFFKHECEIRGSPFFLEFNGNVTWLRIGAPLASECSLRDAHDRFRKKIYLLRIRIRYVNVAVIASLRCFLISK